jgi:transposase
MEEAKPRIRRRHDRSLKEQVLAECGLPGASVAQVALSHGLNANLVHKWRRTAQGVSAPAAVASGATEFLAVTVSPPAEPAADIRIEVRRGPISITITWPMTGAGDCAAWMRELLR